MAAEAGATAAEEVTVLIEVVAVASSESVAQVMTSEVEEVAEAEANIEDEEGLSTDLKLLLKEN